MFFKILIRYLLGYLNIKVEGFFVEKFFNKCVNKKIFFWNVKRENNTIIYMNIGIKDFKELCKIAKDKKCKIKILNKKGFPFLLNKYKKRKLFFILILIMFIIIYSSSKFIWKIEINGLNRIDKNEIEQLILDCGVKEGIKKKNINVKKIVDEIRTKREDIAWLGINIEGTKVIFKIVEAELKPNIINEDEYCNIVASKSGQIVKISAQDGIQNVKINDIVQKGDVLIKGSIEGKYTPIRFLHAKGEVLAKVWYEKKVKIPLKQVQEKRTGNKETRYKIKINNFIINFNKKLLKFKKYDTIEMCKQVKIFSNFYLPIQIIQIDNYEKVEETIEYGIEEAKKIAINMAEEQIEKTLDKNLKILNKYTKFNVANNELYAEITYEVIENIGTKEKMVF